MSKIKNDDKIEETVEQTPQPQIIVQNVVQNTNKSNNDELSGCGCLVFLIFCAWLYFNDGGTI